MTTDAAVSIGRMLSRLTHVRRSDEQAPSTREDIRRIIAESEEPITIEAIATATRLHPNTVRPHLEVLLATGRISRKQGERQGRGRPPWLYQAVESPRDRDRSRLAEALSRALDGKASPELMDRSAQLWAKGVGVTPRPAASPDDAVDAAAESLTRFGFQATVTPARDRIDLQACPYADLVAERPQICDVHAALLQRLLAESGQPVSLRSLDVWSAPGVCSAHLRRADRDPARTITPRSAE